jgi:hypothetical protein
MKREIKNRNILDEFCKKFCSIVDKHTKYIIVLGFLVISSGRTRGPKTLILLFHRYQKVNLKNYTMIY